MTDDIVTRLRIIHCAKDDMNYCGNCLPCQAADEIERLRKVSEDQSATIRHLAMKMERMMESIYD